MIDREQSGELSIPYGAKEMIDVRPELSLGSLACVMGESSQTDDMPVPDPDCLTILGNDPPHVFLEGESDIEDVVRFIGVDSIY